jgi:hypothetical protein
MKDGKYILSLVQSSSFKTVASKARITHLYMYDVKKVPIIMLDLGWKTRHEGLDPEPRTKHVFSQYVFPLYFHSAVHAAPPRIHYFPFLSTSSFTSSRSYCSTHDVMHIYFLFRLSTAPRRQRDVFDPFSVYFESLHSSLLSRLAS